MDNEEPIAADDLFAAERKMYENEAKDLKNQLSQLQAFAQKQAALAEGYRAQINAIILILKSPIS